MRYLTLFLILSFFGQSAALTAQRVLLFEKMTASQSDRLYEGETIRFRMEGDKFWQEGPIREMRPDIQALVINDRYILLDEIDVVNRGRTFFGYAGYSLMSFGVGWSAFALLGYNTDGDPTTQYGRQDITVTLTTVAAGYLINKLLGTRRFKTGPRNRLRIVDTSF